MKKQNIIFAGIVIVFVVGVAVWVRKSPRSDTLVRAVGPIAQPPVSASTPQSAPMKQMESRAVDENIASSRRTISEMGAIEANAIVDAIMKKGYPAIFQDWLDAGHVEHDLMKQEAIASQLGGLMKFRPPDQEFLHTLRDFITNKSNSVSERDMLLGSITYAGTKETEDVLIGIASNASDDVTRSAIGSISILGTSRGGGIQEELAPALDQLWRQTGDQTMLMSAAQAMAQVGAPSSMELLLTAALQPNGQDDVRKQAALSALDSATILNANAVPTLVARLSNESPASETSKYASSVLARMSIRAADRALVAWLQTAAAGATPLARDYSTHTQGEPPSQNQ